MIKQLQCGRAQIGFMDLRVIALLNSACLGQLRGVINLHWMTPTLGSCVCGQTVYPTWKVGSAQFNMHHIASYQAINVNTMKSYTNAPNSDSSNFSWTGTFYYLFNGPPLTIKAELFGGEWLQACCMDDQLAIGVQGTEPPKERQRRVVVPKQEPGLLDAASIDPNQPSGSSFKSPRNRSQATRQNK